MGTHLFLQIGMLWSLFDQVFISQHVQAVLPFPQSHGEAVQKTILYASIDCNSLFRSFFCEMKRKGVLQCHVYKWPLRTIKNKAFSPNDNLAE